MNFPVITRQRCAGVLALVNQRRKRRRECSWAKGREREARGRCCWSYVIEAPTGGEINANWPVNEMS
jgi:hypothetical protein